jgi:L-2-hydroxyglutarate oxidase LhgO
VILGDSVDVIEPSKEGTIKTRKGKIIKADMIVSGSGSFALSIITSMLSPTRYLAQVVAQTPRSFHLPWASTS